MTEPTELPTPTSANATVAKLPAVKKYTAVDYFFQFVTVTAGVLIALLINGLVEWQSNRDLVAEARATIAREVAVNRKDLAATLTGIQGDLQKLDSGLQFANDILAKRPISVNELNFHINLSDLTASAWRTAERTGALRYMDYDEAQRLSLLYDFQDLLVERQRALLALMSDVTAILSGGFDPDKPNLDDVKMFRERLMRLRAALTIHEQMCKRLDERYAEALKQ